VVTAGRSRFVPSSSDIVGSDVLALGSGEITNARKESESGQKRQKLPEARLLVETLADILLVNARGTKGECGSEQRRH